MRFLNNFILLHLIVVLNFFAFQSIALTSDGIVLLSFKYTILADPLSVLNSWNYNDATPCSWTGVSCTKSSLVGSPDQMRVTSLILPNSQLSGLLSPHLSLISALQELDLSGNSFQGSLPMTILNASNLRKLNLANNAISGEIPSLIGTLSSLKLLNLSSNLLSGQIPGDFKFMEVLDLSSNSLTGSIPATFDGEKLKILDLSRNKISGSIPPQFGLNISNDAMINMSFNNLTGEIPQTVSFLNQKSEAFAGNAGLCGKPLPLPCSSTSPSIIPSPELSPSSPAAITSPTIIPPPELSPSSPAAITSIPNVINPLYDTPTSSNVVEERRMQPTAIAGIAIGGIAGLGLFATAMFFVLKRKTLTPVTHTKNLTNKSPVAHHQIRIIQNLSASPEHPRGFFAWPCWTAKAEEPQASDTTSSSDSEYEHHHQIQTGRSGFLVSINNSVLEMETLLKASASILSASNSSIVYKAVMQNGRAYAVRRMTEGCLNKQKDFETQITNISKLQHPNLVRILGYYWGDDEKLIIYDFVPNGSLASFFNSKHETSSMLQLNLEKRVRIARGLARGLAFIHDKKQTHGNIKPTNVLLDSNFEPLISDFGLDRLIPKPKTSHFGSMRSSSSQTNSNPVTTTSPYQAPELTRTMKPSAKSDVYSFGVVLLELLTGKVFDGVELMTWTAASFEVEEVEKLMRMVDVEIKDDVAGREDATLTCLKLGFSCANLAPAKRPNMKEALHVLQKVGC